MILCFLVFSGVKIALRYSLFYSSNFEIKYSYKIISLYKREQGEVQNAMAKTAQVDKLKEERERIRQRHITLTQQNAPEMPQSYNGIQEKQMEVCEICGSFLIVGDAQVK